MTRSAAAAALLAEAYTASVRLLLLAALAVVGCAPAQQLALDPASLGAEPYSEQLQAKIQQAWAERARDYQPRTRHLNKDGSPKYANRLFLESSPYLLQHAHNPVDWHPWGPDAFEKARRLGRPVLLSVGYSTCHWCHVMEEESFEDEEVARNINERYVAIKVDREQRPDVDAVYMAAVQALTGRGGWPMTVWLTPDRKPFYAGTYFPARDGDRGVRFGFLTLLQKMSDVYRDQQDQVAENSDVFLERMRLMLAPAPDAAAPGGLDDQPLSKAAEAYKLRFDEHVGGLKGAPKFPSSLSIRFLLREHQRTGDKELLAMADKTLQAMARGGIYDQVGGGFHRYATDARWLVTHFEKMLYDNALLAIAYLEGRQATGREEFADVARDILHYVGREMTAPEGGFYSATDADSADPKTGEREEGLFFTWTPDELEAALGKDDAALAAAIFAADRQGDLDGRNVLETPRALTKLQQEALPAIRAKLYRVRARRPPPLRDEKVLAGWNGLMISAYAFASIVLDEPDYARTARRAARFVLDELRVEERLQRSWRDGRTSGDAYLEDYAFVIAALIDLYEAVGEAEWLEQAIALDAVLARDFEDGEHGGFFLTAVDHDAPLIRQKPSHDGAEPSGNSVHAMNLLRLYEFTTKESYRERADRLFSAFGPTLRQNPIALSEMLLALDFRLSTPKQVIVAAATSRDEAEPLVDAVRSTFAPHRVLAVGTDEAFEAQSKLVPLLDGKRALRGEPTAYVCENRVCKLPTQDPAEFRELLLAR